MTNFNKIPTTPHYAILTRETIHIPGDERSRTNPGHGYPAENREYVNYEVFPTRDAWLNKIKEYENPRYGNKVDYKAIEVKPAKIEVSVTVGAT